MSRPLSGSTSTSAENQRQIILRDLQGRGRWADHAALSVRADERALQEARGHQCDMADSALVSLIPEGELATFKADHDEIEQFLKRGPCGREHSESSKIVTACTELVTVRQSNLLRYLESEINFIAGNIFDNPETRTKVMKNLYQVILTESRDDVYHRVDISDKTGGGRLMESFIFRSKMLSNGDVALLFSFFQDKTVLANTWKFLVSNHNTDKIERWLKYKLFAPMKAKGQALKDRSTPYYL